jgi:pimeloyl-ACP methyl ester carboxylesterase
MAFDATVGLIDLVEKMHLTIQRTPGPVGTAPEGTTRGITGFVYASIRGVTRTLGRGVDAGLAPIAALMPDTGPAPGREAFVGVLNGVYGDYLARTGNPLATPMRLRRDGSALEYERLGTSDVTGRLLVLVHGLCMTDLRWHRNGHDHGTVLARECGYTPLYLHYNSGLHVSTNGRSLAGLLQDVLARWPRPVEELVVIGHSMGGLVARSACHYGQLEGHDWPSRLRRMVFLGTPHHGALLERGGNLLDFLMDVSPYSAPFTRLGKMRSAGITDLRHGSLLDEDWKAVDRFALSVDRRRPVPLPSDVACYAAAATLAARRGTLSERLVGDGLVPLHSALGRHARRELSLEIPESHQWIGYGMGHMDLLDSPEVCERLVTWLSKEQAR